jgi:phosphatidylglycerophosphate synthase
MTQDWIQLRWRAAVSCLLGWLSLGAAGWLAATGLDMPVRSGLQTGGLFLVVTAWVWYALPQHLPQPRFGWANVITLTRAAGVALLAGLIGLDGAGALAWPALLLALLMLLLDGVDGWLARRHNSASAFGARFDMETDSLFVLVLALLVWQFDKAPGWVILAGLWRYAFVVAGWLYPKLAAPMAPSRRRQTVCVIQVSALLICLLPPLGKSPGTAVALLSLIILSASFCIDLYRLLSAPAAAGNTQQKLSYLQTEESAQI